MDGILNIHKPSGPTSFSIVARVKRLVRESKAGHGGTLDPLASGVLPVFLGQATRLAEYLMEYRKTYRAGIELGVATDSYDAEGKVAVSADASNITPGEVSEALQAFRGEILQKPPMYSALKHEGQPLYKLARRGESVEIESRPTRVYRLDLVSFDTPFLMLDIECSKGTYIRSLAHDLGVALGCGAHLKSLIRTAYGPFDIKDAVTLEQLGAAVGDGSWQALLHPMDCVLSVWERVNLTEEQAEAVRHGSSLSLNATAALSRLRAYDADGRFLATLTFDAESRLWRPDKVFH